MRLSAALKEKMMDVRLRDKFVAEGKLSKEQIEQYLGSLEDESNHFEFVEDDVQDDVQDNVQDKDKSEGNQSGQ